MTTGTLPAYPIETPTALYLGLTKRELFAAMAMQGMMPLYTDNRFSPRDIAEWAVIQTDLLIAELNKEVP